MIFSIALIRCYNKRQDFSSQALSSEYDDATITENIPSIFNLNFSLGRWDNSRRYKFFDNVLSADKSVKLSEKYTVCIATQSSLERLYSVIQMSQHWTGPISAAVFVAGEEYLLTEIYITYMRQCFPHVRDRISFHVAYSEDCPPTKYYDKLAFDYMRNCSNPKGVLSVLLNHRMKGTIEWKSRVLYPQNHMRNLALRNCNTAYVFLTDVDIIPNIGMADNLDVFLRNSHCEKLCAYVIPVYEIDEKVTFPQSKSEMIKLAKNQLARPFHQKIYDNGHSSTNYSR